jgi:hypothetical protein
MNWETKRFTAANLASDTPLNVPNLIKNNYSEKEQLNGAFSHELIDFNNDKNNVFSDKIKSIFIQKNNSFLIKIKAFLNQQPWFIRLTNKEYWHPNVYFIPLFFYMIFLAIKARSPFFFSAANPSIPTGGLVGENKADISRWIPTNYRPKNIVISSSMTLTTIQKMLDNTYLQFPLIIKPTVGARGLLVKKVNTLEEIQLHLRQFPTEFLIEEFIDYPVEAAVLYWRNPETNKSGILSVTIKEFLSVTGVGHLPVYDLLLLNQRGILQIERLEKENPNMLNLIPKIGEKVLVEPIGNHCKGTKFMNFNHLITPEMVAAYDKIQDNLPNCFVYRLDLKVPSVSDLQNGKNVKILEINGVGSDPAHVFDPNFPLLDVYAAYFSLWKKIFEVSTAQHRRGIPYMTWAQFRFFSKQQRNVETLEE